jgi:signal transduction histidine kinase
MGLGLAISSSLIRARGGELLYAPSQRLGGAAFTIRLPFSIPSEAPLV